MPSPNASTQKRIGLKTNNARDSLRIRAHAMSKYNQFRLLLWLGIMAPTFYYSYTMGMVLLTLGGAWAFGYSTGRAESKMS